MLSLLIVGIGIALTGSESRSTEAGAQGPVDVFVRIPEAIWPVARGEKYEDPIDAALRGAGLGEVTGGGSQLGPSAPDGTPTIEWVGIDVELSELERGLPLLKRELRRIGAPAETAIESRRGGTQVSEGL
ncbi:hypothetical protein [Luteimonas terrae]|uniref:Uncharacterized protein n=1 Tax=Luteimonas terrae TaxID=1530191 RepID=A0ABU1XT53_9GAMM|nr:hypothetical protein [Luteimonas terrae]MDR7191940.1 hypothetical protein [Luteimonas terrae]